MQIGFHAHPGPFAPDELTRQAVLAEDADFDSVQNEHRKLQDLRVLGSPDPRY